MKVSKLALHTLREAPNDAIVTSHKLMMRADLVRKLGNGLYSYMPLGLRAFRKVVNIVAEELDAAGFTEIRCPVMVPSELWQKSGRFSKMAGEMLTATSRTGQVVVVSPTCEEAFTFIAGVGLSSYKELPLVIYQINTKYRDEIRPRYGVMRGREFTMMDAYSFNTDDKSLDATYHDFSVAYQKIFKRLGLNIIRVKADTGMIGGTGSEEFMVPSPVGDDTLILCKNCDYAANVEKASCKEDAPVPADISAIPSMQKVDCPGVESISQMEAFFKMSAKQFIKVLLYKISGSTLSIFRQDGKTSSKNTDDVPAISFVAVAIRGDLEVNEAKLASALQSSGVELASAAEVVEKTGAPHGFVGPTGLAARKLPLVVDKSVVSIESSNEASGEPGKMRAMIHDTTTGSGTANVDLMHVEPLRDFVPDFVADFRTVIEGDTCPICGGPLYSKKGNELGHIFKLGTKYTEPMGLRYLDTNGKPATPTMGCYGIGIDRTLASIIEEHNDERGIIWPASVAPFHVIIVPIKYSGQAAQTSDDICKQLEATGLDVLVDDRNERPGVKFCDADLIGIPARIIVNEKKLPQVELKLRKGGDPIMLDKNEVATKVHELLFG